MGISAVNAHRKSPPSVFATSASSPVMSKLPARLRCLRSYDKSARRPRSPERARPAQDLVLDAHEICEEGAQLLRHAPIQPCSAVFELSLRLS